MIPEYVALVRTLGGNGRLPTDQFVQNAFDYVRKNIEVEFRFGLGKGGRGALIDQSGTPFDLAELMVKLLRQGGVTQVTYQVGTIMLGAQNVQQFGLWTGLVAWDSTNQTYSVDARQACQLLADGGIPATVNGANDCSQLSGALSSVTILHIWVQVGGVNYDPSYKSHVLKAGIDVPAALGCGTTSSPTCGATLNSVVANGASTGTDGTGQYIENANRVAVENQLQNYAVNLQSYIQTHDRIAPAEDIVGGMVLSDGAPTPYALEETRWTWTGDIPNPFRTNLRVRIGKNNVIPGQTEAGGTDVTLFADDMSGKRIQFGPEAFAGNCTTCIYDKVILDITHPYLNGYGADHAELAMPGGGSDQGSDGAYPITIVLGLGAQTESTEKQIAALEAANPITTSTVITTATDGSFSNTTFENTIQSVVAAKLLAQGGRSDHLVEGLTQSRITRHHVMGIVYARPDSPGGASYVNVQSAVSVNTGSVSSPMRHPAFEAQAAIWALLEGSASAQGENADKGITAFGYLAFPRRIHLIPSWEAGYDGVQSDPAMGDTAELKFNPTSVSYGIKVYGSQIGVIKGGGSAIGNPLYTAIESTKFQDKSAERKKYLSVSPADGGLTLKATDLLSGAGSFPQSLPFQRTYQSNSGITDRISTVTTMHCSDPICESSTTNYSDSWQYSASDSSATSHIGGGWNHNYNVTASASTNVGRALGSETALDASASIAALWSFIDQTRNLDNAPPTALHSRVAMALNMNWLAGRFSYNAVVVDKGGASEAFQRLPDGSYNSLSGYARLVQQGEYIKSRGVADFTNVTLAYTGKDGDVINFAPYRWRQYPYDSATWDSFKTMSPDFGATVWTFPNGTVVNFQYMNSFLLTGWSAPYLSCNGSPSVCINNASPLFPYGKVLTGVSNNLGRSLSFDLEPTYAAVLAQNSSGQPVYVNLPSSYRITGVHDGNDRHVTFALTGCPAASKTRYACNELTVTGVDSTVTKYSYNAADYSVGAAAPTYRLASWYTPSDPNTPYQTAAYDGLMRVASVTDKLGHTTNYYPGAVASSERWKRSEVVDPLGYKSVSVFDQWNSLLSHTDANSRTWTNTYDNARRKLTAKNPEGDYISYDQYDARSNLLSQTQYPKLGSPLAPMTTSTTYMVGPTVLVTDTANCDLITCNKPHYDTNARGFNTYYGWKMNTGLLASVLSGMNADGSCPYGAVCPRVDLDYVSQGGVFMLVTALKTMDQTRSLMTTFTYNPANHNVLSTAVVDPNGLALTTSLSYDAIGNLTHMDGPRTDVSDVADYTWDANRRLTMAIQAMNDNGSSHPRIATQYTYDADGQLIRTDQGTTTSATGSDFVSSLAKKVLYDPVGNAIQETHFTSSDGTTFTMTGIIQSSYDADDRLLCAAVRMNNAKFASNPTNSFVNTGDSSTAPDACSLGTVASNGDYDRITQNTYDAAGQLTQVLRGYRSPTPQIYARYRYTCNGKQRAIADADVGTFADIPCTVDQGSNGEAHQTKYIFDGFDRLVDTIYADGTNDLVIQYDNDNNPTTKITRGNLTLNFTYDSLDRVAAKTVPATNTTPANTVQWQYDLANNATVISDALGNVLTNCYDLIGRPLSATTSTNGVIFTCGSSPLNTATGRTVSFAYDNGAVNNHGDRVNRSRITWPDGSYTIGYGYDAMNRMTGVCEGGDFVDASQTCGSGTTTLAKFDYDKLGHVTQRQHGSGSVLDKVNYAWSNDGDLNTLTHAMQAESQFVNFNDNYNPAHQIVSSAISNPAFQYLPPASVTASYAANGLNQYSSVGGQTIDYDGHGNLACAASNCPTTALPVGTWAFSSSPSDPSTMQFVYDPENRLLKAKVTSTGVDATYAYDPLGRRITKTVTGGGSLTGTTYYLNSGDDEIAEYDGSGNLKRRFVPGPGIDQPIAMVKADGTKTFFHQDKTGSVIAMTDASGAVVKGPYTYDPYGNCTTGGQACGQDDDMAYRYTGRRFDPETGLYYYRARYYSASLGRFLQTDPIGYKDDVNWYAYVGNDPTDKTDPGGTDAVFGTARDAVSGRGHITLYYQNAKGEWFAYDKMQAGGSTISGYVALVLGATLPAKVTIQSVTASQVPKDGIRLETNSEQDKKIAASASASADRNNSGEENFNLWTGNCKDGAVGVVNDSGAGITVSNTTDPRPNHWFDKTKNDPNAIQNNNDKKSPPPPPPKNCIANGTCSPY